MAFEVDETALETLEETAEQCTDLVLADQAGRFKQAVALASGMNKLRQALTPQVMEPIMELQGSRLGFRTDKDRSGGYGLSVVREAVIEATLRGVRPVGNEFNIIAGNAYITKEGFTHLVRSYPGLTDYRDTFAVPKGHKDGAVVHAEAEWKLNGKPQTLECDIPVRVNKNMGIDAILGKAKRKLLARVYARVTGTTHTLPEGDVDDTIAADFKVLDDDEEEEGTLDVDDLEPAEDEEPDEKPQPMPTDGPDEPDEKPDLGRLQRECQEANFTRAATKAALDLWREGVIVGATPCLRVVEQFVTDTSDGELLNLPGWGKATLRVVKDRLGLDDDQEADGEPVRYERSLNVYAGNGEQKPLEPGYIHLATVVDDGEDVEVWRYKSGPGVYDCDKCGKQRPGHDYCEHILAAKEELAPGNQT
ncbi:MAG: hypothetical protein ACOC7S_00925 [Planctomycetota bacterium]